MPHFLDPPFGLSSAKDQRLQDYLEDEDWHSATVLLRDVVNEKTTDAKWLVLLAYVRFQDASQVVPDSLPDAAREALALLERAMNAGASHAQVAPLLDAAQHILDHLSRQEAALFDKLKANGHQTLSDEELEHAASLLEKADPTQAQTLYTQLAQRHPDTPAQQVFLVRAALALSGSGDFQSAKPALEAALLYDWSKPTLSVDRLTLESVETVLLEHASKDEFEALWQLASERGRVLSFPFPSAWPHQERLFARCIELGELNRARALADRIEDERTELSHELMTRFQWVRLQHA